jgi:hypothetical protein
MFDRIPAGEHRKCTDQVGLLFERPSIRILDEAASTSRLTLSRLHFDLSSLIGSLRSIKCAYRRDSDSRSFALT